MIEFRQETKDVPTKKICDKCGMIASEDDYYEFDAFHHLYFTSGYCSVFGDGTHVECDICQHCLHEMIKDFYAVSPNNSNQWKIKNV